MKLSCIIGIAFLSLFLCSCNEEKINTSAQEDPLQKARTYYEEKNWEKASIEFDLAAKSCHGIDQDEARLGSIVCRLFDKQSSWEEKINLWKPETRGYWHGKSFTTMETIPLDRRDGFYEIMKREDIPLAYFLLMQFVLLEGHEHFVSSIIEKMPLHKNLAWDLALLSAWENLKQKQGNEGESLFEIIYQNAISPEQKEEAACGILLGNFFAPEKKKEILFPSGWDYRMDLKKISVFRSSSPIHDFQVTLEKTNLSLQQSLIFCDILFTFGGFLPDPVPVWEKGLDFLNESKGKFTEENQKLYDASRKRFWSAIAWFYWIKGDLEKAGKNFIFETHDGKKEKEDIGQALIAWKQDISLSDIAKQFSSAQWKEEYFVGGKKISFYRLASREKKRAEIEKLWNDPLHKIAFILFDIFCLTGDGRSAHILLDQIVSEFPENIYSLYMAEEENIPKDPYAENQIWEKLD